MPSLPGQGPAPIDDLPATSATPARTPTAAATARWNHCHGLTSGLPGAAVVDPPRWPATLPRPFGAEPEPEPDLPLREALARPGELRALGVSVVPCLVLTGGRPTLAVPVPAGSGWHPACHVLATQASATTPPDRSHSASGDLARTVAHDLRGPLLSAGQLIDLALEGPEVGAAERLVLQQAGRAVHTAAQRLEALRQFMQLDREPLAPQSVDAGDLVRTLAAELDAVWPHPKRRLLVAPTLPVHADPGPLQLALRELLDNAFKFSQPVDAPAITVALHRVPGYAVLALADNGPGFSAAHAGRLFGLFQRLHLASEFPGLGAGLALVRRMAERHGGWAWADLGTPGRTVFLLALPEGASHHA
jgi:two-component sensor histidine kinase